MWIYKHYVFKSEFFFNYYFTLDIFVSILETKQCLFLNCYKNISVLK